MRISDWSSDVCSSDLHPGIKIREFTEEINSVTESVISNWFHERLLQWGVSEGLAVYLNLLGLLFALTVIVIVVAYLTRKILVEAVSRIASKTNRKSTRLNSSH